MYIFCALIFGLTLFDEHQNQHKLLINRAYLTGDMAKGAVKYWLCLDRVKKRDSGPICNWRYCGAMQMQFCFNYFVCNERKQM